MKTLTQVFTRQQYLNNECTHDQYYNQFVTNKMIEMIIARFGKKELLKAFKEDKNLNSIALSTWDNIGQFDINSRELNKQMKGVGDYTTLAGLVCIGKAAARLAIQK